MRDEVLGHGRPLLGVCVGMQLLADRSMEGATPTTPKAPPGWAWYRGGWNTCARWAAPTACRMSAGTASTRCPATTACSNGIPDGTDFYFVHSYAFVPQDTSDVLATTDYGVAVTAAVHRGHVWGTQFHPEKSSKAGFRLLKTSSAARPADDPRTASMTHLKVRVIPTLLWKQFGLVKGVGFDSWRRTGAVLPAVKVFNQREVDELVLVDIVAHQGSDDPDFESIEEFGQDCFVPLTVGGGITRIDQVQRLLRPAPTR